MKEVVDNGLASLRPQLEMLWGPHDLDGRCFDAEERARLADADVGIIGRVQALELGQGPCHLTIGPGFRSGSGFEVAGHHEIEN